MRKFLIVLGLGLGLTTGVFAAETLRLTLADGTSLDGDIVKFDDHDAMIHTTADGYTNIAWPQFSQDSLKLLAANPKYRFLAEPFIAPTASERPAKPEIRVNPVWRMTLPEHPSILGGLAQSSLGLFLLLVIYAANLYAAYEVAAVRGKPVGLVMGLSAVLPILGPIIFLSQPMQAAPVEEAAPEEGVPGAPRRAAPRPRRGRRTFRSSPPRGSRRRRKRSRSRRSFRAALSRSTSASSKPNSPVSSASRRATRRISRWKSRR